MFPIFSFSKHILKIKKYVSSNSLYPLTNYNKSDHIQYFFKILKRNKTQQIKRIPSPSVVCNSTGSTFRGSRHFVLVCR